MLNIRTLGLGALFLSVSSILPAMAGDVEILGHKMNLQGSLRGGSAFGDYVPPVLNPLFNETPHITTEIRPFYAYHDVPDDFVTGGGTVQVAAAQIRVAFSERLGLIATTDGYTNVNWEGVLTDDDGSNDIAFGLKYAFHYAPEEGEIVSAGIRYTAPAGNISTFLGPAEIELNGVGAGFINVFATGQKVWNGGQRTGAVQLQGSGGFQVGLSKKNYSFFHGSATLAYEALPGFYPLVETSVFVPVDSGNRVGGGLSQVTGAEFLDVGNTDAQEIATIGGGLRWKPCKCSNAIFGVGAETNYLNRQDSAYGYRVVTDLVLHF